MISDNVFIQALQELNNHQIQHGECSITFTYHDGRVQFYTVSTSERHNVVSPNISRPCGYRGCEESAYIRPQVADKSRECRCEERNNFVVPHIACPCRQGLREESR